MFTLQKASGIEVASTRARSRLLRRWMLQTSSYDNCVEDETGSCVEAPVSRAQKMRTHEGTDFLRRNTLRPRLWVGTHDKNVILSLFFLKK